MISKKITRVAPTRLPIAIGASPLDIAVSPIESSGNEVTKPRTKKEIVKVEIFRE
ncbi:MAG: hypothetical protein Fur0011_6830 [Candidatus Microgenomates bacterium]